MRRDWDDHSLIFDGPPNRNICQWMAAIPIALMAVGTIISAQGQKQAGDAAAAQGQAQKTAANYQADQLDQQAGQDRASSQHAAVDQRHQADLVQSSLLARAAASGGGASDPTVNTLSSQIEGEGEYRALTALFNGEERARGEENSASLARFTGDQYAAAGYAKQGAADTMAMGTIVGGAGSLFSKYGGGTPATPAGGPSYTGATGQFGYNTPGGLRVGGTDYG